MRPADYTRELRELLEGRVAEDELDDLVAELLELRARDVAELAEIRSEPLLELAAMRARVDLLGDYLRAVHVWQARGMLLGELPEPPGS